MNENLKIVLVGAIPCGIIGGLISGFIGGMIVGLLFSMVFHCLCFAGDLLCRGYVDKFKGWVQVLSLYLSWILFGGVLGWLVRKMLIM